MSSQTAWLLWPCRRTWDLFRQTRQGEFRHQTPCSNFPTRLRARTPKTNIRSC